MSYDCRHGAEMCDQCLDIMSDGIKQGAEQERERIIALLEEHRAVGYAEETTHDALIALIKQLEL